MVGENKICECCGEGAETKNEPVIERRAAQGTDKDIGKTVERRIESESASLSRGRRRAEYLCHRLRYPLVLLLGGMFLCGILYVSECTEGVLDLFSRALLCSIIISEAEFIFGVMFNLIAGLGIWDYTEKPLNLLGQVCAEYSLLWLSLSLPAISLFDRCGASKERRE